LWEIFADEYLPAETAEAAWGRFRVEGLRTESAADEEGLVKSERIEVDMVVDGQERTYEGRGTGPLDALVNILSKHFDLDLRVQDYVEHAIGAGAEVNAAAYVECAIGDRVLWGAG